MRVIQVHRIGVVAVRVLRNELFSHEDKNEHDSYLENRLTYDMFEHGLRNDVFVSGMRLP